MIIDIKKLQHSEIEIKFSIPWDEWKIFLDEAAASFSKELKIKGFRPGKAPRDMVEQRVGKKALLDSAAEKAVRKKYADFLKNEKISALGSPRAEILKLAEGNNLEFKITTAVMPEIEIESWEKEIKKLNVDFKKKEVKIAEDEVEKEIGKIAESRAKLITVSREAKKGDAVFLDFKALQGGVPIENGSGKNHPLILGSGVFIPGFEENIIGLKEKEEKNFELDFPGNYHEKNLAGKKAAFNVKINLVQERQIPPINDEFAKSLGDFENLEKLRASVREGIKEEKTNERKEKRRSDIIGKIIEKSKADLPEILVSSEILKMAEELEMQIEKTGMKLDDYLNKIKKKKEDLEKEWQPEAVRRVKAAFILEKLAKENNIEVPNKEIEKEMNEVIQRYKKIKDAEKNIDLGRLYNYVRGVLLNEKVFEYLERL